MSRRAAWTVVAAGAWTIWIWSTRIWNLLDDPDNSVGFKAVHTVLALVSIAFAIALVVIGTRALRARAGSQNLAETDEPETQETVGGRKSATR